jgi:hypothetical protein
MALKWDDLSKEEQEAVRRIANGPYLMLTTAMANRLKALGLAEQKLGGTGLSKAGHDLYRSSRRRTLG